MAKPQLRRAYQPLPRLLQEMREDAGLTQRELAQRLKLPQNTIYRMENGIRRCDAVEFAAWARGCGADPIAMFQRLLDEA